MNIPEDMIYSLHSISPSISSKLPSDMPLHGLLATDLALRVSSIDSPWLRVLPSEADFAASLPFMWPEELQKLLPGAAKSILKRQQDKFQRECDAVAAAFPDLMLDRSNKYRYFWLVVNTRSFFHETPEMEDFKWEDKLCLLPMADLFNHSSHEGCKVTWWDDDGYTITADRTYHAGEELCISYGEHTNDFLLVEYGFTVPGSLNPHDAVGLDGVILPKLDQAQREALARQDLLGGFKFHPGTGPCEKTRAAIARILQQRQQEQMKGPSGDDDDNDEKTGGNELLESVLRELLTIANERLERLRTSSSDLQDVGETAAHRGLLIQRWEQISQIISKGIKV